MLLTVTVRFPIRCGDAGRYPAMVRMRLRARHEASEVGCQDLVDRPLEIDGQRRKFRQIRPAPGIEFRVRIEVEPDVGIITGEPEREPALLLAAVASP